MFDSFRRSAWHDARLKAISAEEVPKAAPVPVVLTRGRGVTVVAGPKIDKMLTNVLWRFAIHGCVDVRVGDQETVGGQSGDRSFGNAEVGQGNVHTLLVAGL